MPPPRHRKPDAADALAAVAPLAARWIERLLAGHAVDGRYLSTEVAGGMTGRMLGVTCTSGGVLVRSFEYTGADDPSVLS